MYYFAVVLRVDEAVNPSAMFRGFFIQARLAADDSNVGGFLSPQDGQEYQLSSCTQSTVSMIEYWVRYM